MTGRGAVSLLPATRGSSQWLEQVFCVTLLIQSIYKVQVLGRGREYIHRYFATGAKDKMLNEASVRREVQVKVEQTHRSMWRCG